MFPILFDSVFHKMGQHLGAMLGFFDWQGGKVLMYLNLFEDTSVVQLGSATGHDFGGDMGIVADGEDQSYHTQDSSDE